MNDENLQGILIRLTKQQHQKLKEKSQENDVSIAGLVRLAVTGYLQEGC